MNEAVIIDKDTLGILVAVAQGAIDDLDDGLADGTYEDDEIGGYTGDTVRYAITAADALL